MITLVNKNPFYHECYAYIKDTNLKVQVIHIANAFLKSKNDYVDYAVVWFEWTPDPHIMARFIQYRSRAEAIMSPIMSVDINQAAIPVDQLVEGPTENELGKVLYSTGKLSETT